MMKLIRDCRFQWFAMMVYCIFTATIADGQKITAKQVDSLYRLYPTKKSTFCSSCKVWVNPFYESITDTVNNYPVWAHTIVTAAHVQQQEATKILRAGVYADWNVPAGTARVDAIYSLANKMISKPNSIYEVAYGHNVLCWILSAWCWQGAVFSNTEIFGEFMEYQGQNIGTMINTEDSTRMVLGATINQHKYPVIAQSVEIWAGCYLDATKPIVKYTVKGRSVTVPDVVWKIIRYNGITKCYWMPNLVTENQAAIVHCHISYADLCKRIGFEPFKVSRNPL
jgi:hypothetical protein